MTVFERVARKYPERVAASCGSESLSYGALERHAEEVARGLRASGSGS